MKHKRFLFLLTAAVAFIIQLIDIISYKIKFSITQTFVLVIIQMIGLVGYAKVGLAFSTASSLNFVPLAIWSQEFTDIVHLVNPP